MAKFPHVYESSAGASDVIEFLDGLSAKDLAKCRAAMTALAENERPLQRPFASFLRDHIWELRVQVKRVRYRFLFAQLPEREYVILLALQKSKSAVPPACIDDARTRLVEWRERSKRS